MIQYPNHNDNKSMQGLQAPCQQRGKRGVSRIQARARGDHAYRGKTHMYTQTSFNEFLDVCVSWYVRSIAQRGAMSIWNSSGSAVSQVLFERNGDSEHKSSSHLQSFRSGGVENPTHLQKDSKALQSDVLVSF
mmetsp:Transcript_21321/g.49189  ORF Transcript_21321/g.49189 Transcript_21321/m.49189 type:complete len:133 (+) Transcript_21321:781-1179(+)